MNTFEIATGNTTAGNFTVSYQKNGYGAVIPTIDGVAHPELMMGYVSESDMRAGMKLLEDALRATNGDTFKAMLYMYEAASMTANGVKAEEAVDVDGDEYIISYTDRKIYYDGYEVANLEDIQSEMSNEVIKALLIERAKRNA